MNHTDINEPFARAERSAIICMNCGGIGNATARCNGTSDKKQSWCDKCRASAKDAKQRRMDVNRERAIEDRERAEVLTLLHERGREHQAEHCPLCREAP